MRSVRRKAAITPHKTTAAARGGAELTSVRACRSPTRWTHQQQLTLNEYALIVQCPGDEGGCGFITDVYGAFEWQMWIEEDGDDGDGNGLPECPKCGEILRKAERQYVEL